MLQSFSLSLVVLLIIVTFICINLLILDNYASVLCINEVIKVDFELMWFILNMSCSVYLRRFILCFFGLYGSSPIKMLIPSEVIRLNDGTWTFCATQLSPCRDTSNSSMLEFIYHDNHKINIEISWTRNRSYRIKYL